MNLSYSSWVRAHNLVWTTVSDLALAQPVANSEQFCFPNFIHKSCVNLWVWLSGIFQQYSRLIMIKKSPLWQIWPWWDWNLGLNNDWNILTTWLLNIYIICACKNDHILVWHLIIHNSHLYSQLSNIYILSWIIIKIKMGEKHSLKFYSISWVFFLISLLF